MCTHIATHGNRSFCSPVHCFETVVLWRISFSAQMFIDIKISKCIASNFESWLIMEDRSSLRWMFKTYNYNPKHSSKTTACIHWIIIYKKCDQSDLAILRFEICIPYPLFQILHLIFPWLEFFFFLPFWAELKIVLCICLLYFPFDL